MEHSGDGGGGGGITDCGGSKDNECVMVDGWGGGCGVLMLLVLVMVVIGDDCDVGGNDNGK